MKITIAQLKKIVREEILNESTRSFQNMELDLEKMKPGSSLDIDVHTSNGIKPATIIKQPLDSNLKSLYDFENDDNAFIYKLLSNSGKEIMTAKSPYEITKFFNSKKWEFSY